MALIGALEEVMSDLCVCVCVCVCVCTLCNRALRMALKEFLQHSKESRGVLKERAQASKQTSKQVSK